MTAKSFAPHSERNPPEIFWRSFIMRPSRAADPRRLLQPVAGGWQAAIAAVQPETALQFGKSSCQRHDLSTKQHVSARNASMTASPPTAGVTPSREAVSSASAIDTLTCTQP